MSGDALAIFLFLVATGFGAVIGALGAPSGWRSKVLWCVAAIFLAAAAIDGLHPQPPPLGFWKVLLAVTPLLSVILTRLTQGQSIKGPHAPTVEAVSSAVLQTASDLAAARAKKERAQPAELPTPAPEQIAERVFIPSQLDAEALIAPLQGHNNLQASRISETYVGKWMRVDAFFNEISSPGIGDKLLVFVGRRLVNGDLEFDPRLSLLFEGKFRPRLEILPFGCPISAIGRIARITKRSVDLEDCELIEANPTLPGLPLPPEAAAPTP